MLKRLVNSDTISKTVSRVNSGVVRTGNAYGRRFSHSQPENPTPRSRVGMVEMFGAAFIASLIAGSVGGSRPN